VEYRNKDPDHVEWAKALKDLYMPGLRDYVKKHYPLGPVWGPAGGASQPKAAAPTPKAPAVKAPPPPAPPSAPLFSTDKSPKSSQPKEGMSAVFQEISSKSVTAGTCKHMLFLAFEYLLFTCRSEQPAYYTMFLLCRFEKGYR
jgi:adenylyl cyclase-associated protein